MRKHIILWIWIGFAFTGCQGLEFSLPEVKSPSATATVEIKAATPMPTSTPAPTATATPTPTPTLTPTATPEPNAALEQAQHAQHNGDWDNASELYNLLLSQPSATHEQVSQAMYGLSKNLLAQGVYEEAIELLTELIASDPQSAAAAEAHVYLADALVASGDPAAAAEHYAAVLSVYPQLTHYARQWQGDALYSSGSYDIALNAYQESLETAPGTSERVFLWEKIALTHAALGDAETAIAAYDTILEIAQIARYRARIMYQAADTALVFGDSGDAYQRMHALVTSYPSQSYAHKALVKLVEAGEPVDDYLRGLVDYHASAYDPGIAAFYRYIETYPEHNGDAYYYIGLSYLEAENYPQAELAFDTLINNYPDNVYMGSAWIAKARALDKQGASDAARSEYQSFATSYPGHSRAPEALWKAAELLEEQGELTAAADAYRDLATNYPQDEGSPQARLEAGLLHYRGGSIHAAHDEWDSLINWYPGSKQAQGAQFWLGRTYLESNQPVSGTQLLQQAAGQNPWEYYGLRAADTLSGQAPYQATALTPRPCGSPEEQYEAEVWLANWMGLDSTLAGTLGTPSAELAADARLQRGTLLLKLGHFDDGRTELEGLREATIGNALTQYQLALYYRDIGLYRSSIIAATSLWHLSPAGDIKTLPRFIGCLIYPTYYSDLVEPESAALGLDPLLIYSLMRQESLFEGDATSYAYAYGLMQVIPATGQYIMDSLGWPPNYETQDLYRPLVSVRYGTWYLAQQRDRIDDSLFAALAGYNGGPGNAMYWWEEMHADTDLFVEDISLTQTRSYVELIRKHYAKYQWLYGTDTP